MIKGNRASVERLRKGQSVDLGESVKCLPHKHEDLFQSLEPTPHARHGGVLSYNPSAGEWSQVDARGSLVSHFDLFDELEANERAHFKNQGGQNLRDSQGWPLASMYHSHLCACTHSHVHMYG